MSSSAIANKIQTTALRSFLQKRYLKAAMTGAGGAPSVPVADSEAFVTHNITDRGHKLLNLIYVLRHKSGAAKDGITAYVDPNGDDSNGTTSGAGEEGDNSTKAVVGAAVDAVNSDSTNSDDPIVALLGRKARAFGVGLWNGFGGKVDIGSDASITASAARELEEEVGLKLVVSESSPSLSDVCRHVGILFYQYPIDKQPLTFEVHVYCVNGDDKTTVLGTPFESEEMHPVAWFEQKDVPLSQMWADDPVWLPQMLSVVAAAAPISSAERASSSCSVDASIIDRNIEQCSFVGYVDFLTMSEVRGSCVLMGKNAVADVVKALLPQPTVAASTPLNTEGCVAASLEAAKRLTAEPLRFFDNDRCPIH